MTDEKTRKMEETMSTHCECCKSYEKDCYEFIKEKNDALDALSAKSAECERAKALLKESLDYVSDHGYARDVKAFLQTSHPQADEKEDETKEPIDWARAGGPNECKHGYAKGIRCPKCESHERRIKDTPARPEWVEKVEDKLEQIKLGAEWYLQDGMPQKAVEEMKGIAEEALALVRKTEER